MLAAPPLAYGMALEMGAILLLTLSAVVAAAIPLTTGLAKGHVTLGIVGALIGIPAGIMLPCVGSILVGCGLAAVISIIPKVERPLLSQSEIEAEMRRLRGY